MRSLQSVKQLVLKSWRDLLFPRSSELPQEVLPGMTLAVEFFGSLGSIPFFVALLFLVLEVNWFEQICREEHLYWESNELKLQAGSQLIASE